MADIGGGKSKSKSKTDVTIPDWLQPFVNQSVGTAGRALGGLEDLTSGDTVADLTPDQLQALQGMRNFAGGEDGVLPQALAAFQAAAGASGLDYLDPEIRNNLGGAVNLTDTIGEARDATAFTQNQIGQDQLEATARGDYLFGGEGFDAAVNAAMNAALPQIASAFGGSVGGASGAGLADVAVGQAAVDAVAKQYGAERGRQVGAAGALDAGSRADRAQYLDFGGDELSRRFAGNQLLAGLSDTEQARALAAAGQLPGIGMMDDEILMGVGDILQGQEQRELSGPLQNQLLLMQVAMSGLPISAFLGQRGKSSGSGFNFGIGGSDAPWYI